MNKEFVKKLVKAEMLRYEAFKEILPGSARKMVDGFEKNAGELIRELAVETIKGNMREESPGTEKAAKKVNVDFS
jgi:hypothetical protein